MKQPPDASNSSHTSSFSGPKLPTASLPRLGPAGRGLGVTVVFNIVWSWVDPGTLKTTQIDANLIKTRPEGLKADKKTPRRTQGAKITLKWSPKTSQGAPKTPIKHPRGLQGGAKRHPKWPPNRLRGPSWTPSLKKTSFGPPIYPSWGPQISIFLIKPRILHAFFNGIAIKPRFLHAFMHK